MKTVFRLLMATAVAAACMYALYEAHDWFAAESLLGPTIEHVVEICFAVLAIATVLIWFGCSVGFLVDTVRWLRCRRRMKKREAERAGNSVVLTIGMQDAPHLYDAQQEPVPHSK